MRESDQRRSEQARDECSRIEAVAYAFASVLDTVSLWWLDVTPSSVVDAGDGWVAADAIVGDSVQS